jgi:hypothetical protein
LKIQLLIFIFIFCIVVLFGNMFTPTINATATNEETNWTVYKSYPYGISFGYPPQYVPTEPTNENLLLTVLLDLIV